MAPSAPRATITEHSSASGSIFSSTQGTGRPIPGSGQLGGVFTRTWPLPS
jgi:hypothetical protein